MNRAFAKLDIEFSFRSIERRIDHYLLFNLYKIFWSLKHILMFNGDHIYTRSVIPALVGRLLGKHVVCELHQLPTGGLKFLYKFANRIGCRFIAISNTLSAALNLNLNIKVSKVLHDGINEDVFTEYKFKEFSEISFGHTGSLYKLTPVNFKWLKMLPNTASFTHIGDTKDIVNRYKEIYDYTYTNWLPRMDYSECRKIQNTFSHLVLLLNPTSPIFDYTSPLKFFEYMSTGATVIVINPSPSILELKTDFEFLTCEEDNFNANFASKEITLESKIKNIENLRKYTWFERVQAVLKVLENV